MKLDTGVTAEIVYDENVAKLTLGGKPVIRIEGTARLVTDKTGALHYLYGIATKAKIIQLKLPGRAAQTLTLAPDAKYTNLAAI